MSVIAHTIMKPFAGKRNAAAAQVRQVAGIYARHGAAVKPVSFVAGPYANCLGLLRAYPDFQTAARTFGTVNADPAYQDFNHEREANPLGEIVSGRNISRRIFGEGKWPTHPVTMMRSYELMRDKVPAAVEMLGEVDALVSKGDVNVVGLSPITGDDLSTMMVAYQFRSMEHLGEALDTIGTSDEMRDIIARACEIGTLRTAGVMVPL